MRKEDEFASSFGAARVAVDERRRLIRRTFEQVAPRYDLMNDLMSMGVHRLWKASFVAQAWLRPFYGLWSRTAIPALGAAVSGKPDAYRYLVESIRRFPSQPEFADMITAAGFVETAWRDCSSGIAAVHSARKPAP